MSDSQLEKHIKNTVDGHISPIDTDALWTDIQQRQQKPAPYWKILSALFLLFLLGAGMTFYWLSDINNKQSLSENKTITENIEPSSNSKNKTKVIEKEFKHQSNDINQTKARVQTSNKPKIDSKEKLIATKANNPIAQSKVSDLPASIKKPTKKLNSVGKAASNQLGVEKVFMPKKNKKDIKNNLPSNQKIDSDENAKSIQSAKSLQLKNETNLSYNIEVETNKKPIIPKTIKDIEIIETNKKSEKLILTKPKDKRNNKNIIQLLKTRTENLDNTIQTTLSVLKPNLLQMPLPKKRPLFELGIYSNYEYAFRKITKAAENDTIFAVNDSLVQSYIKARNDSETFVESFRAGLFLRKSFMQGLRVTAGIEYAQLTERFDAQINLGQFTVYSMLDSSKQIIVERKHIKKIYNRYKTWNLPVLIGKKFSKQSWSFCLDMGIAINLKLYNTGQLFADRHKKETIKFNTNEPSIFKAKTGINYLINVGFAYSFKNGLAIEFGPHFQSTFSSVNQHYGLDTRYYYLGVKAALVKEF